MGLLYVCHGYTPVWEEEVPQNGVVPGSQLREVPAGLPQPEGGHHDGLHDHGHQLQHLRQVGADLHLQHLHLADLQVQQAAVDQGEGQLDVGRQDRLLGRRHVLPEVVDAARLVAPEVVVEAAVDRDDEAGEDDGAGAGGEDRLPVQLLVHRVPEGGEVQTLADVGELEGEVCVEHHEDDVKEDEGEDGHPDGEAEVADDEVVPPTDEADVGRVLDEE